jgi:hypothetical protein
MLASWRISSLGETISAVGSGVLWYRRGGDGLPSQAEAEFRYDGTDLALEDRFGQGPDQVTPGIQILQLHLDQPGRLVRVENFRVSVDIKQMTFGSSDPVHEIQIIEHDLMPGLRRQAAAHVERILAGFHSQRVQRPGNVIELQRARKIPYPLELVTRWKAAEIEENDPPEQGDEKT